MLFSSLDFIFAFLPVFLVAAVLSRLLGYRAYLITLAGFSLYLYAYHVPIYLALLVGSAAANYGLSMAIANGRRTWLYYAGIAANVAVLAWFKYANFVIGNVNWLTDAELPLLSIILPLAISFITFEQIAFLTDVRSGKVDRGSPIEYFAFITLFPKLIAGPIIRYTEILPQFRARQARSYQKIFTGLCIFSFGLFKKVVIADSLAPLEKSVFEAAGEGLISASDAFWGTLAYTGRIYFDFAGYSAMAIGLAWMFGIRLPINFLSPYRSRSIIEFWRRWHISLSAFLRDYIYIPLGGNRHGEFIRYRNVILTMLIGGLWHGAGWTFVVWGAIHGFALAVNHGWRAVAPEPLRRVTGNAVIAWLLTMTVVVGAWVFFNAVDFKTAANIFASLHSTEPPTLLSDPARFWIAAVLVGSIILPNAATLYRYEFPIDAPDWSKLEPIPVPGIWLSFASAAALVLSVVFLATGELNDFIYFQF